jgi:hypothetical protein
LLCGSLGTDAVEPFTETMQSRGERRLLSRLLFTITRSARVIAHAWSAMVVGHSFDTRDIWDAIATFPPPREAGESY